MNRPLAESIPLIALLAGLVLLAVFLAAAETALIRVSASRARALGNEGDRRAARVADIVDDLPRVLNAVLLAVLLTQIGAATVAGVVADRHFGNLGVTATSVGLTLVMFVYAEAIPKTVAVRHPLNVARHIARPVSLLALMLRPIVVGLIWFADLQAPGSGVMTSAAVTEVELRHLAEEAHRAGEIERSDFELIERAFRVGDASAAEVVVPRTEIVATRAGDDLESALEIALQYGHRRLPVYESDLDDITGVVRLRDLAGAVANGRRGTVSEIQRPLLAVPETRRIIGVVRDLQEHGGTMALVVDEHGGTTGIVTIEDILEELVGEVRDEEDALPDIRATAPGRWAVRGSTDIVDLNEALHTGFEQGDFHTVAGLILEAAGRVPRRGEEFVIGDHRFRIAEATRRRIRLVEVYIDR